MYTKKPRPLRARAQMGNYTVPTLVERRGYLSGGRAVGDWWNGEDDTSEGDGGVKLSTMLPAPTTPSIWDRIGSIFGQIGAGVVQQAGQPPPGYVPPASPLASIMPIALIGGGLLLVMALRK